MGSSQLIVRGALAAALLTGALAVASCSRPTASPDQATAVPQGQQPPAGYPGEGAGAEQPTGPKPGEPGYPPPNPLNPTAEDPYPGMTATAAAGGAVDSGAGRGASETPAATGEAPAATAKP